MRQSNERGLVGGGGGGGGGAACWQTLFLFIPALGNIPLAVVHNCGLILPEAFERFDARPTTYLSPGRPRY